MPNLSDFRTNSSERKWALFCYIPAINCVTCVLTAVRMVNNEFCRFHSRQGLVLFGVLFLTMFTAIISETLSLMLWGVTLLLHIAGIAFSLEGKIVKIPVIGQFAMKIPEYYIFTALTGKLPEKEMFDKASVIGAEKPGNDFGTPEASKDYEEGEDDDDDN